MRPVPTVLGLSIDDERLVRAARRDAVLALLRRRPTIRIDRALAKALGLRRRELRKLVDRLIDDGEPIRRVDEFVHRAGDGRTRLALDLSADELATLLVALRRLAEGAEGRQHLVDAARLIHRVGVALPEAEFARLHGLGGFDVAPRAASPSHPAPDQRALSAAAIEGERKLRFLYVDGGGSRSARTVWPLRFTHGEMCLVAWCEARSDFRTFRLDRMAEVAVLDEPVPLTHEALLARWREAIPEHEDDLG